MIALIHVFERIRKQRKYQRIQLYETTNQTPDQVRRQIKSGYLPTEYIEPWCKFLDLGIRDYSPLIQYNERHKIYLGLRSQLGFTCGKELAKLITNLIYFQKRVKDWEPITMATLGATISFVEKLPHEIDNAIADLATLSEKELLDDDE